MECRILGTRWVVTVKVHQTFTVVGFTKSNIICYIKENAHMIYARVPTYAHTLRTLNPVESLGYLNVVIPRVNISAT